MVHLVTFGRQAKVPKEDRQWCIFLVLKRTMLMELWIYSSYRSRWSRIPILCCILDSCSFGVMSYPGFVLDAHFAQSLVRGYGSCNRRIFSEVLG